MPYQPNEPKPASDAMKAYWRRVNAVREKAGQTVQQKRTNACERCEGVGLLRHYFTPDGEWGIRQSRMIVFEQSYPDARDFGWSPCSCAFEAVQDARWINAGIPERYSHMTFDSFDALPDDKRRGKEGPREASEIIASGSQLHWEGIVKNSLVLYGSTGMGKSGLMAAVAQSWIGREVSVLWCDALELIDAIRKSYEEGSDLSASAIVERAQNAPLLCLDDLGDVEQVKPVTDHTREKIYAVIRHRHVNQMPTMITTNLSQKQLGDQFGKRITDRIYEMAHVVQVRGDNLRFNRPDLKVVAS
jgi:DNA replication protein DnaC